MDSNKIFSAIKSFVVEINNIYGHEYKHLALYGRLLEKTEIENEIPVQKHVHAFRRFVLENRAAILAKDVGLFKLQKIKYNDNVYFNVAHVLKLADADSQAIIWEHLLVLSALLDKNSDAKNQLIQQRSRSQPQPNMLMPMMNMMSSLLMGGSGGADNSNPFGGLDLGSLLGGASAGGEAGGMPDISKILGLLMNSDLIGKLTSTLQNSVSDGKLDLNYLLNSLREVTQELNLDLNIPKDAADLQNGLDDVLGMFSSMGISKEQVQTMVDTLSTTMDGGEEESCEVDGVSEVSEQTASVLVDTTVDEPLEPGIQVCYLDGHCE